MYVHLFAISCELKRLPFLYDPSLPSPPHDTCCPLFRLSTATPRYSRCVLLCTLPDLVLFSAAQVVLDVGSQGNLTVTGDEQARSLVFINPSYDSLSIQIASIRFFAGSSGFAVVYACVCASQVYVCLDQRV